MMDSRTYRRKMDTIVEAFVDEDWRGAVQHFDTLVRDSNVQVAVIQSQLKTALFEELGPKLDKMWAIFRANQQQRQAVELV